MGSAPLMLVSFTFLFSRKFYRSRTFITWLSARFRDFSETSTLTFTKLINCNGGFLYSRKCFSNPIELKILFYFSFYFARTFQKERRVTLPFRTSRDIDLIDELLLLSLLFCKFNKMDYPGRLSVSGIQRVGEVIDIEHRSLFK